MDLPLARPVRGRRQMQVEAEVLHDHHDRNGDDDLLQGAPSNLLRSLALAIPR